MQQMALRMALTGTCRCAAALPLRPLPTLGATGTPCRVLRRRVGTVADAAAARLPPRLRLNRPAATAPAASADSASALSAAARLLALGVAAAGGIGGGYFIGTAVRAGLRPPTPAELEVKQLQAAAAAGNNEAIHNLGVRVFR